MDTFDTIINSIYEFGSDVFFAFFGYGFIGSMIGLMGTIIIVRKLSKAGKFDRPNKVWRFFASINKVWLPLVAMVFFGFMFGAFGVNSKINDHVESTIYATIDEMNLETFNFSGLDQHMKTQMTLEEMLASEISKASATSNSHESHIVSQAILQELGFPSEIDEVVNGLRSFDWTIFEKGSKFGLSYVATDYVDGMFWFVYRFLIVFFIASFLKLSIIECIIYMIYSRVTGFKSSKESETSQQSVPAYTEFV